MVKILNVITSVYSNTKHLLPYKNNSGYLNYVTSASVQEFYGSGYSLSMSINIIANICTTNIALVSSVYRIIYLGINMVYTV